MIILFIEYDDLFGELMQKNESGKWSCKNCNYNSQYSSHVKSHIESHHVSLSYSCIYCSVTCPTKGALSKHVQRKHKA